MLPPHGAKMSLEDLAARLDAVAPLGPLSYEQLADRPTLGTAAAQNVEAFATAAQGAKADTALQGTDPRLSDARPASDVAPWAKAGTKPGYTASEVGADAAGAAAAVTLAGLGGVPTSRKVAGKALTSDVALTASDVGADPAGAAAAITLAGLGGVATTDPRLTNARTPTAHATTHLSDGSDPLISATAATPATTGTQSVPMPTGDGVKTITPTGACTFNASGGKAGARCTLIVTTSGTSSFTLTFGTNFKAQGTLATGTTSAKVFAVSFVCKDGTLWVETGRTAAM